MPSIHSIQFGGIRPQKTDDLLKADYATRAHNTKLRRGDVRAFRQPKEVHAAAAPVATIYKTPDSEGCCSKILTWPKCVFVHPVELPGCAGFGLLTVFHTDGTPPQRMEPCSGRVWPLAVPAPTTQLSATLTTASPNVENIAYEGPDERSYTYTWVDIFGVESAPAVPSVSVKSHDDEVWELTGFDIPPPQAVAMRLYRTGARAESGKAIATRFDTSFQLVEEVDVADITLVYVDARRLIELDYGTLMTADVCAPPAQMCGVVDMDIGYLAGFTGNTVRFSQRYEHWNWPEQNVIELPDKVVAIAAYDDMLFVGTTGKAYRIKLTPTVEKFLTDERFITTFDVVATQQNYPALTQHTMVATGFGAVFVSSEGLIAMQRSGPAMNLTRSRIDEDMWRAFIPNRLVWQNGVLYGSRAPAGEGFRLDIRSDAEGGMDIGDFVTLDLPADALHAARDGEVYFAEGEKVYQWDAGDDYMTYTWKSKVNISNGLIAYSAAKVVARYGAPVKFTLYTEHGGVMVERHSRTFSASTPVRIPHQGRNLTWQFQIEGTTPVSEVHIATSVLELAERING